MNCRIFAVCAGIFAAFIVGCGASTVNKNAPSQTVDDKIHILATVGMVADLVRNVGGEHVQVRQLMGPGVDPHLYKATRDDVLAIMQADVVFYSGLMLEGKMTDSLERSGREKPVIAVTKSIDPQRLLQPKGTHGHPDPHVWMDVSAWAECLEVIVEVLSEFDPQHASVFRENAAPYRKQLDSLHQFGLDAIGSIPKEQRLLITSHDAFSYFGRAYGLEVHGVQGISTESEAGLQQINSLVDFIVTKQVPAVFVESSVPRKSIETLVQGAASRGHKVKIGGELFSDAMGKDGTPEGTYIGMLRHNITTVTAALGGTLPLKSSDE